MGKNNVCLATILMLLLAGGCGTLTNLKETAVEDSDFPMVTPRTPFGGVQQSGNTGIFFISAGVKYPIIGALGAYFMFLDTPLSMVGDVLTLPYVLAMGPGKFVPKEVDPEIRRFWKLDQPDHLTPSRVPGESPADWQKTGAGREALDWARPPMKDTNPPMPPPSW